MKKRLVSQALVVHAADLMKCSEPTKILGRGTGKLEREGVRKKERSETR